MACAVIDSLRKECPLRSGLGKIQRLSEVFGSGFRLIQTRVEVTQHRMQQIVGIQFVTRLDFFDGGKTCRRAMDVRDDNRAIEGNDRRMVEFYQLIVEAQDLDPVRRLIILGCTVACGKCPTEGGSW